MKAVAFKGQTDERRERHLSGDARGWKKRLPILDAKTEGQKRLDHEGACMRGIAELYPVDMLFSGDRT